MRPLNKKDLISSFCTLTICIAFLCISIKRAIISNSWHWVWIWGCLTLVVIILVLLGALYLKKKKK